MLAGVVAELVKKVLVEAVVEAESLPEALI